MSRELEIGKRYTWGEVVKTYHAKWIRMNDCTLEPSDDIVNGVFMGAYADDDPCLEDIDIEIFRGRKDKTKNDRLRRTEIGMNVGIIDCLNAVMEVRDEP